MSEEKSVEQPSEEKKEEVKEEETVVAEEEKKEVEPEGTQVGDSPEVEEKKEEVKAEEEEGDDDSSSSLAVLEARLNKTTSILKQLYQLFENHSHCIKCKKPMKNDESTRDGICHACRTGKVGKPLF